MQNEKPIKRTSSIGVGAIVDDDRIVFNHRSVQLLRPRNRGSDIRKEEPKTYEPIQRYYHPDTVLCLDLDQKPALKESSTSSLATTATETTDSESNTDNDEEFAPQVMFTPPDVYGQKHPIESPELIQYKLYQFDLKLDSIPAKGKKELMKAQKLCPEVLDDRFKLMFLCTDVFDVDKAANWFVKYWKHRADVWGDRAYRPITASVLTESEKRHCRMGVFNLVESKDGRNFLFCDPSFTDISIYKREDALRGFEYFIMSCLDDDEVSRKGIIGIGFSGNAHKKQLDPKLPKTIATKFLGAMPFRFSAWHVAHPPHFVNFSRRRVVS